jgi:hypothetical protein
MIQIKTVKDIEKLEKVSMRCSEKYVPIKTSDYVREIQKHFPEVKGKQYTPGSNKHFVILSKPGSSLQVYIENSFDRSSSLRISFKHDQFVFGYIKQVHMGKNAIELKDIGSYISELYNNASKTLNALQDYLLPKKDLEAIAKIAFRVKDIKDENLYGLNYNFNNTLEFINYLIDGLFNGNFSVKRNGTFKQLKPSKSKAYYIKANKKIWDFLIENNPELQL